MMTDMTSYPGQMRNIKNSVSAILHVCLSASVSQKLDVQTSRNVQCKLSVLSPQIGPPLAAIAVRYVLPVLRMTSLLLISWNLANKLKGFINLFGTWH